MKEIETLVEEKKKDSSEMAMIIAPQEGEYYTRMTREPDVRETVEHLFLVVRSYLNKSTVKID